MSVFNKNNEKFILAALIILAFSYAVYSFVVGWFYYRQEDMNMHQIFAFFDEVQKRNTIYGLSYFLLSLFYVRSTGFRLQASFDSGMFFYILDPFLFFYAFIREKKWRKGLAFIFFWIIGLSIGQWAWLVAGILAEWGP